MAGPHPISRSRRRSSASTRFPSSKGGHALLVIDNVPLQQAAWAEFHAARKRLDKTSGDLHRHEQIDVPAYQTWLHQTFPIVITTLRQLHQEVFLKERQIQSVQAMAEMTGQSEKSLWRELKEQEVNPEAYQNKSDRRDAQADDDDSDDEDDDDSWSTEDADNFFDEAEVPRGKKGKGQAGDPFDFDFFGMLKEKTRPIATEAKDIYRRLVQLLHPDRGGEWTLTRQRLWHEVQQAWARRDADWLSRLEIEWETANDVLSPTSPLSRLRRAIKDIHAARRDIERKLREYRNDPPWKFTLSEKKRGVLHARTEGNFKHDIYVLKNQLTYLDAIIADWERPRRAARHAQSSSRSKKGGSSRHRARSSKEWG